MNLKSSILIPVLLLLIPMVTMGQANSADHKVNVEIPEIALLGLIADGSPEVNFMATSPEQAGNAVTFADKQNRKNIWVNYSSIVSREMPTRKIVAVVQGDIPAGVQLMVKASEATGNGNGKLGHPVGTVKLSNEPTDVIVDIGSCYTGKGVNNGHFLTYQLDFNPASKKYAQLIREKMSFNVIYTLTDRN